MGVARKWGGWGDRAPARRLHGWAVDQSRRPILYADLGVADDPGGRFESLTAHVILLIERLEGRADVRQALFDVYISDLDGALREMGVGDLAVAKRMKTLGSAFYGRAKAYAAAFAALPDESVLEALLGRTLCSGANAETVRQLRDDVLGLRRRLASLDPLDPTFLNGSI